jgi:hypothetical protein
MGAKLHVFEQTAQIARFVRYRLRNTPTLKGTFTLPIAKCAKDFGTLSYGRGQFSK